MYHIGFYNFAEFLHLCEIIHDQEGGQAVHGEVKLDGGDARDQVGRHLEEVRENVLVHLEDVLVDLEEVRENSLVVRNL